MKWRWNNDNRRRLLRLCLRIRRTMNWTSRFRFVHCHYQISILFIQWMSEKQKDGENSAAMIWSGIMRFQKQCSHTFRLVGVEKKTTKTDSKILSVDVRQRWCFYSHHHLTHIKKTPSPHQCTFPSQRTKPNHFGSLYPTDAKKPSTAREQRKNRSTFKIKWICIGTVFRQPNGCQ